MNRWLWGITFAAVYGVLSGCHSETPSLAGSVPVPVQNYKSLVITLDEKLKPFGLYKRGAPGLKELANREVLFYAYAQTNSAKRPVVISDVKQEGIVEFHFYRQDFETEAEYEQVVAAVIDVLNSYGKVEITNYKD